MTMYSPKNDNTTTPPGQEKKGKVYIAGKVTDLPYEEVKAKFAKAELWLKKEGYSNVINPIKILPKDEEWKKAMLVCIDELMKCDAICLLPDWETSKGARIESTIACELGLKLIRPSKN